MKHRGEIVNEAIRKSGLTITDIAKRVGYSRRQFYNILEDPNLSIETVLKIGKVIERDFKKDFPEIFQPAVVNDPQEDYTSPLVKCLTEKQAIAEKYISLLENHNLLLKQGFQQYMGLTPQ